MMRPHTRTTIALLVLLIAGTVPASTAADEVKVAKKSNSITIGNSQLVRELKFSEEEASGIQVLTTRPLMLQRDVVKGGADIDWFEIFLDNGKVSNRDKQWVYEKHSTRNLENGGIELRVSFHNVAERLLSLRLEIVTQMFPNVPLCREKIILAAGGTASFSLTPPKLGPLLVFPAYLVGTKNKELQTETITLSGWGIDLIPSSHSSSFDERTLEVGPRVGRNLAQNYMYHPSETSARLNVSVEESTPGPVFLARDPSSGVGVMTAYEHGAPDGDKEQEYVSIRRSLRPDGLLLRTAYNKGVYHERQKISAKNTFESPWNVLGFFDGRNADNGKKLLWEYLDSFICESKFSRIPQFYYNTWGMQRDEERRGKNVRTVLTKERVLEEIESAAKLNVDLFVLDDGWQDRFGDWNPDPTRYDNGLKWYVDVLRKRNIMPGLWLATLATDPAAEITKLHPEWLIRDEAGKPIVGRWEMNFFCFASDYRDYYIKKCKERIDEGIRYFKWDGIDKHLCSSPLHQHGDTTISAEERKLKQGFDIPLLVADAIRQLKAYQPDVVVEVDVTEPHRSVGLAILSEGKYFWMNNGASAYGDYSTHRSKSNRFISNLYHQLIPPSLLTFANYPHNSTLYSSYRSNVNSSLTGGRGFWGNLALMTKEELERVGKTVRKSKAVMHDIAHIRPTVTGTVGSSPEIYEWVNKEKMSGQVVGFSGSARVTNYAVRNIRPASLLAVLNNAFTVRGDSLVLRLEFGWPEASREAFILPNGGAGMSIVSSTSWIDEAEIIGDRTLRFIVGAPGTHRVRWNARNGAPMVTTNPQSQASIRRQASGKEYSIEVVTLNAATRVEIRGSDGVKESK